MKHQPYRFQRHLLTLLLIWTCSLCALSNTTVTVTQVEGKVTLTDDVDYVVTSKTPFISGGQIDIVNTEHAVVILSALKPSEGIKELQHILINGQTASNNVNCQVKIHNRGCIIMPYNKDIRPLTVYSEPDFQGEAVDDFGLENSGGFMNTLTDEKLNNRIHSFKLKRGYMVTFSTRARGRGYSRCFIAATKDLEIAQLPSVLDGRITSYRIFKWNDTSKSGIANDTRSDPVSKLNVTSCYSFGLGEDRGSDCECVPHHIYEDWPSASACGSVKYSPHMKTNNEPGNSADDHPQSVDDILNNWENLMATGMRLCSPSSHDGSLNHLRAFMDSIDARGWRCDIIDLHCYWTEGSFNNIKSSWVDRYHRPIWISEWVWGASWNNNGIFGIATGSNRDNPTASQLNQNKTAIQNICSKLNSWDYIERYYYWNSEANCSKLYLGDGSLTPAGEYYAGMNTGLGYNGRYDYVPNNPRTVAPGGLSVTYDKNTRHASLTWKDTNGEFNNSMTVERKIYGGDWEVLSTITPEEGEGKYTYEDANSEDGYTYRIHVEDFKGGHLYSQEVTAMPETIGAGEVIHVNGSIMYLGGNVLVNGDFALGMTDWQNGEGADLSKPSFSVSPVGGPQGGPQLIGWTNMAADKEGSLRKTIDLTPNTTYYFSAHSRGNGGGYQRLSFTTDGINEGGTIKRLDKSTDWSHYFCTFKSANYKQAMLAFRWLAAKSQFANLTLCPLFETREEAVADGVRQALRRAQAVIAYNTTAPELNAGLQTTIDSVSALTTPDEQALKALEEGSANVLQGICDKQILDELISKAETALEYGLPHSDILREAITSARESTNYTTAIGQLRAAWQKYLPMTASTYLKSPDFDGTEGWVMRCGSYTQGSQYPATKQGRTCWLAQWTGVSATEGKGTTMQIKQEVSTGLTHGIYMLQCDAMTEHNCLSDQHGYLIVNGDTLNTGTLTYDRQDIPSVTSDEAWQTLSSHPIFIDDDTPIEVGFVSSKAGAEDGMWLEYGNASSTNDLREGSWCATGFKLLYHPLYKRTADSSWGTICLPYAATASEGVTVYRIAGLLADSTKICLEEVSMMEAGMPYIYHTDVAEVTFFETGNPVDEPLTGDNNLRGYLRTNSRNNVGNYVLVGDGFYLVTTGHRSRMTNYTALIRTVDGMNILDSFNGPTLSISNTPWNEIADGIVSPTLNPSTSAHNGIYTLDGRRIQSEGQLPTGIYIQVKGTEIRKIVVK